MAALDTGDLPASRLANLAAPAILEAFVSYQESFTVVTRRALSRFERHDWKGAVADSIERLDLYGRVVDRLEREVRRMLGARIAEPMVWAAMKAVYSASIAGRPDLELAETFFNSVTRRVFTTVGVNRDIEFVDSDFEAPPADDVASLCKSFKGAGDSGALVEAIVRGAGFSTGFEDLGRDCRLAGERLDASLRGLRLGVVDHAEVVTAPFFRRKGAYLVGRLFAGGKPVPFVLALLNQEQGIIVDAVLTDENDISILFSFTRSHFHVDAGPPHELASYLRLLMPKKPVAELYIALGHHKHGKTLLYRDLLRYIAGTEELFIPAPGTPGMVMAVFTMPGYDVVLKVIRDRFPAIKPVTPDAIRQNYRLVFRHDRAGRLVEAQEFEHLEFDLARFAPELLREFERDAAHTVAIGDGDLVVHHAYIERRVIPLDVYLREASEPEARAAIIDFGQAIKDLAANGIFPGELLPKNFGVTRHSRIVCYDYDELGLLTDFTFRTAPQATHDDDDYSDGAWFGVGPRDLFPEEFARFLGLRTEHRQVLDECHPELYDVGFWTDTQERVKSGEVIDIFPYQPELRLTR